MTAKIRTVSSKEIAEKNSLRAEDFVDAGNADYLCASHIDDEDKEKILATIKKYLDDPTREITMTQKRPMKKIFENGSYTPTFVPEGFLELMLVIKVKAK